MRHRPSLDVLASRLERHEKHGLVLRKAAGVEQVDLWRALQAESAALRQLRSLAWQPGRAAALPLWLDEQQDSLKLSMLRSFLPGRSLSQLLAEGPLAPARVVRWMGALAGLLAQIHGQGLCHGDLSTDNLLILPAGELILLDWGAPDLLTPAFAPPEGTSRILPATDVYALARVWLRCLSENQRLESVPAQDQRELLRACLDLDPQRRPSAQALADSLGAEPRLFPTCVGRRAQLQQIGQHIAEAPRRAIWLALPAPSGMGKSEFLKELASRYSPCLWGQGTTLRSPSSFTVFQEIARAFRAYDFEVELSDSHSAQLLGQVFPALSGYTSSPPGPLGPLGAGVLAAAWAELLQGASHRLGHLLLIVDDAQWIDDSSQQLLGALFKELGAGVTVLVSWRADQWEPPAEIKWTTSIELGPLLADEVEEWAERGGLGLNHLELSELYRWSGGLPLLLRYWMDDPGRSVQYSKVALLLEDRAGQLDAEQQKVLQTAALLGKSFHLEPLLHLHPETCRAALARAEELQILLPAREHRSFSHDRLRDLCLQNLSPRERQERHCQLADYYLERQSESLREAVHHLYQAGRLSQAAPLALLAARRDKRNLALHSARQFYEIHLQQPYQLEVWLEYCQVLNGLNCTHQARAHLQRLLDGQLPARLRPRVVEMNCEFSFELMDLDTMKAVATRERWKDGVRSLGLWLYYSFVHAFHYSNAKELAVLTPLAAFYCSCHPTAHPLLSATLISGFDQLGFSQQAHSLRAKVSASVSRSHHPQIWGPVQARLNAYRFGDESLHFHLQCLRELELEHERVGVSFDLAMVLMQIGYYAICRGDLEELFHLSRRLHSVGLQMRNPDFVQVALHLEVEARGGRSAWKPLAEQLQGEVRTFLGHAHLVVAAAQVKLRRGQPEQAWHYINLCPRYGAVYDNAMVFTWRACVARHLVEKTPRWQAQARQRFLEQGLLWVEKALEAAQQMKSYLAQALREKAWLMLAQAKVQEARVLFGDSARQALHFGARLQEGLSRRDWGLVGIEAGWPEAAGQLQEGRGILRQLGYWWELGEHDLGVPLEDLAEVATAILESPQSQTRQALEDLADPALVEALERLACSQLDSQRQLRAEDQRLQTENKLWRDFIQSGQVCARSDLALELPARRSNYLPLQRLLQLEGQILQGQLRSDAGLWPAPLLEEWARLGSPVASAWGPSRELPWERLDPLSAHVLRCVLREVESNGRQHGQGPLQWHLDTDRLYLTLSFHQRRQPGSGGGGFGTEGMKFRLAQIGGELSVRMDEEFYHLTLRMMLNSSVDADDIRPSSDPRPNVPVKSV